MKKTTKTTTAKPLGRPAKGKAGALEPRVNVKVAAELRAAALIKARRSGMTLGQLVVKLLTGYVGTTRKAA